MEDVALVVKQIQDHLAPRLDTYEQALYLYLFRHTRLVGVAEAVFGFKSERKRLACGIGEKGKPMSENTAYVKLQSLEAKGCITIVDTVRDGRRISVKLPTEIPGIMPELVVPLPVDLETEDFFVVEENRARILEREGHRCFYCLRKLANDNHVIEHTISRPVGDNSYRNVVASCTECNNRKDASSADDWLRTLYREGLLDAATFQERQTHLERLREGGLKPPAASV
jgi:hypothetical protein